MSDVPPSYRAGPFLMFSDPDGMRHAVKVNGVIGLSDADETRDSTLMLVQGGRVLVLSEPLDVVISWFA